MKVNFFMENVNFCKQTRSDVNLTISVTAELSLDIQKFCTNNINHPFCFQYYIDNPADGITPTIQSCFSSSNILASPFFLPPSGSTGSTVGASSVCYPLVSTIFTKLPNQSSLAYDQLFSTICSTLNVNASNYKKYTNGSNVLLDSRINEICACHLPLTTYDNFYNSLTSKVDFLTNINLGTKQCLFPDCGSTLFRSSAVVGTNVCPSLTCINVTNFNNNGTVEGGFNLVQNNDCSVVVREKVPCTTTSDCPTNKTYECRNQKCEEKVCNLNSDCPSNQRCMNNTCVSVECNKDSDCSSGKKCLNQVCVQPTVCFSDAQCTPPLVCSNRQCVKPTSNLSLILGLSIGGGVLLLVLMIGLIILLRKK
jgi:hypothetical protein